MKNISHLSLNTCLKLPTNLKISKIFCAKLKENISFLTTTTKVFKFQNAFCSNKVTFSQSNKFEIFINLIFDEFKNAILHGDWSERPCNFLRQNVSQTASVSFLLSFFLSCLLLFESFYNLFFFTTCLSICFSLLLHAYFKGFHSFMFVFSYTFFRCVCTSFPFVSLFSLFAT